MTNIGYFEVGIGKVKLTRRQTSDFKKVKERLARRSDLSIINITVADQIWKFSLEMPEMEFAAIAWLIQLLDVLFARFHSSSEQMRYSILLRLKLHQISAN